MFTRGHLIHMAKKRSDGEEFSPTCPIPEKKRTSLALYKRPHLLTSKARSCVVSTERTILSPFTKEYRVLATFRQHTPIFGGVFPYGMPQQFKYKYFFDPSEIGLVGVIYFRIIYIARNVTNMIS
jgi:hypothetical protein